MTKHMLLQQTINFTFGGEYPDVPFSPGVDVEALTEGDSNPTFVTIPFARDGLVADDGMRYTEQFNDAIMEQAISDKPEGSHGHISPWGPDELPKIIWVGATKGADGTRWIKGYVADSEYARYIRAKKSTGSKLGTSIQGFITDLDMLEYNDDGTYEVKNANVGFDLLKIDIVPAKMQALDFERKFEVTAHKQDKPENEDIDKMSEITLNDVPEDVRQAIIQQYQDDNRIVAQMAELKDQLQQAQSERDGALTQLEQTQAEAFETQLRVTVSDKVTVKHEKASALKAFVLAQAKEKLNGDFDQIDEVVDSVLETEEYQALAEALVSQISGGNVLGSGTDNDKKTAGEKYEEMLPDLRSEWGI